jgi:hypothetical protein
MDTDLADRLSELKSGLAAIDSRTQAIHDNQEKLNEAMIGHEERNRSDFKELHDRVTGVERKQNWMLGVGTTVVFVVTLIVGFFKGIFGG